MSMNAYRDFPAILALDARRKRRLPTVLQRLWRLDRRLCPVHGCGVRLAWDQMPGWDTGDYDTRTQMVPLRCHREDCAVRIMVWDWNEPGYEERPWCIEYLPEADQGT